MLNWIKDKLARRKQRRQEKQARQALQNLVDAVRERAQKAGEHRARLAERNPAFLLKRAGLPNSWFTKKRTNARRSDYRKAFYSLPPAKRKLVAARYGDPS